jgi:hypothetical protein
VRTRIAVAAAAGGRWEEAERSFSEALETAAGTSNDMEVADIRRLHARALLDRGRAQDAVRAEEMLGQARDAYRTFGMPSYVAEVEGLLSTTSRSI